jgi:hypothetical protein
MAQATSTHPAYDVAAFSRRAGVLVIAAAAVLTVMVRTHGRDNGSSWHLGLFKGSLSLFSWAHLILVALLLISGLMLVLNAANLKVVAVAAALGLVPAAQLGGAGIVAVRHWHPAAGMSGPGVWANQPMLVGMAGAGALAAGIALLVLLRVLVLVASPRAVPTPSNLTTVGRFSVVIGALAFVSLPLLLSIGDPDAHDLTSLGAFALLWSLPWGGALALTALLPRAAAIATGLTVAVSAASAYPNYELVSFRHHWVAVLTGLVSGLLVAGLRWTTDTETGPPAEPR